MYVKVKIEDLNKHLEKNENDDLLIKEAYCKFMNRLSSSPFVPSDFNIKYYFGQLKENQYVVVMENDIRLHTMEYPKIFEDTYYVGLISFKYLPEIICVIYDGEYYAIFDAYKSKIISLDDVKIIKKIYESVIIE